MTHEWPLQAKVAGFLALKPEFPWCQLCGNWRCFSRYSPEAPRQSWYHGNSQVPLCITNRAISRFAPSQWETSLQSNAVSHWLDANLKSALYKLHDYLITQTCGTLIFGRLAFADQLFVYFILMMLMWAKKSILSIQWKIYAKWNP